MTPPDSIHGASLGTRILQGAGLAAGLTVFRVVAGFGSGLNAWQVSAGFAAAAVGGGAGGIIYYATDGLRAAGGMKRTFANVVSLLVYCFVAFGALILVFGTE